MRTYGWSTQKNCTSHVIWENWLYFCKAAHVHKTTSWQVGKVHTDISDALCTYSLGIYCHVCLESALFKL